MKSQSHYFQKEAFFIILVFLITNYGRSLITKLTGFSNQNLDEMSFGKDYCMFMVGKLELF